MEKGFELYIKLVYNKSNARKVQGKENEMEVITSLKDGGKIVVRIENGLISEAICQGSTQQKVAKREEVEDIKWWLKNILNSDVEKFKEILGAIKKDECFYWYGKELLDRERNTKVEKMLEFSRECFVKLEKMQEEASKYCLPD